MEIVSVWRIQTELNKNKEKLTLEQIAELLLSHNRKEFRKKLNYMLYGKRSKRFK